jgi:hypothetical protein
MRTTAAVLLLPVFVACARDSGASRANWVSEVDTLGDTISVRTVAGSVLGPPVNLVTEVQIGAFEGRDEEMFGQVNGLAVDAQGNIYVYDNQVPALRKYGPDGTFIATFGRKGGGPGEYSQSDGGLAVLRDGRIVLRDPGNARYTIYHPDGALDTTWPGRGGWFTSTPLFVDTAGFVYPMFFPPMERGISVRTNRPTMLVRTAPDGTSGDTLQTPMYDYEPPTLVAQSVTKDGTSTSVNNVPFSPTYQWTFSPLGYFIAGVSNRYAVDLHRPDGTVLRIGRDIEPIAVSSEESADAETRTTASMRRTEPDWKWNGPGIPDVKPAYRRIFAGQDGRIWVQLSMPGEEVPVTEEEERTARTSGPGRIGGRMPSARFVEPVVFDVFEPDGRYIGQVRAPRGFSLNPQPIARGDYVWAVFRDELDVNYVARFKIGAGSEN